MEKKPGYQVTFTPEVLKQLSQMDPQTRAELMKDISETFGTKLSDNPWLGTPLFGPPWFKVYVWFRRHLRRFTNAFGKGFAKARGSDTDVPPSTGQS